MVSYLFIILVITSKYILVIIVIDIGLGTV